MTAYYNEIDPFAADVLENLILCGVIPAGVVDRRSIEDVQPSDLKGFIQCHFFAGFGVWPYAMRQAGWPDDCPAWTGSCPCPPFSTAGRKKACPECDGQRPIPHVGRTGYFVCCLCGHQWLADGRHLWPEFWRLIRDERPPVVFGEQVAGADGLVWLDLVRASLEILAYAAGAADLCAAGVGAPHIRQRTYWVAHPNGRKCDRITSGERRKFNRSTPGRIESDGQLERGGASNGLEHAHLSGEYRRPSGGKQSIRDERDERDKTPSVCFSGETRSFWKDADWLLCRNTDSEPSWRPVEPGTFPLVNGYPNRMGALRGYGNAIVAPLAQEFVEVVMEYLA